MTAPAWGRVLPALHDDNTAFWASGSDGVLRIARCDACGHFQHPPSPVCQVCRGHDLTPTPVSGGAQVATFTVNVQPWFPDLEVPYTLAMVELDEDPAVRLTTAIVGCEPADVHIGLAVEVSFRQVDDVWLPLFTPKEARP